MGEANEVKVKSLQKALEVLNCFLSRQPLGVTEISEELGLYKSSVSNILATFSSMEYVEKDDETGKFRLGVGIYRLSRALGDHFAIDRVAQPFMQKLSNKVGESVVISVPVESEIFYVGGTFPDIPLFSSKPYYIGTKAKMYCTSSGKAMLAFMDEKDREKALSVKLEPLTPYTITDLNRLKEELELIRVRGYATDHMECVIGLSCVAVPLFTSSGHLIGSLAITGPAHRIEGENTEYYVKELLSCKAEISAALVNM